MTMLTIDDFREADFPDFFELIREWGPDNAFDEVVVRESLRRFRERGEGKILMARLDGVLAGYAQIEPRYDLCFEPYLEVVQLLVTGKHRSEGIGGAIMKRVEEEAGKSGIKSVKLSSQIHRSRAHVFYETIGYSCYKISKFYEKMPL